MENKDTATADDEVDDDTDSNPCTAGRWASSKPWENIKGRKRSTMSSSCSNNDQNDDAVVAVVNPSLATTSSSSFESLFKMATDKRLGQGSFGQVYCCYPRRPTVDVVNMDEEDDSSNNNNNKDDDNANSRNDPCFAVKVINLSFPMNEKNCNSDDAAEQQRQQQQNEAMKVAKRHAIEREVDILRTMRDQNVHNVVGFINFFHDTYRDVYHIVQQYAGGGNIFQRLVKRKSYTEKNARDVARVLLSTIEHIHTKCNIVHRDLKPQNILLKYANCNDTEIMIADFGFARFVQNDGCLTMCGTPNFIAPEILMLGVLGERKQLQQQQQQQVSRDVNVNTISNDRQQTKRAKIESEGYGKSVDLWSIGCLLYMLIGGYCPFRGGNHREIFRKIRAGDYQFYDSHFGDVTVQAKRLISRLLTVNPAKRCTAEQARNSEWLSSTHLDKELDSINLASNHQQQAESSSGGGDGQQRRSSAMMWGIASKAVGFATSAPFWNPNYISFNQQMERWDSEYAPVDQEDHKERQKSMLSLLATTTTRRKKSRPYGKWADPVRVHDVARGVKMEYQNSDDDDDDDDSLSDHNNMDCNEEMLSEEEEVDDLMGNNNERTGSASTTTLPAPRSAAPRRALGRPALTRTVTSRLPLKITFQDVYEMKRRLDHGEFKYSEVWECIHRPSSQVFAVKKINRQKLPKNRDESALQEVTLMQSMTGCRHVIQLFDFYEEPNDFYLVMEYMQGGDVFERVTALKTKYTERDARDLAYQLLKAVQSLHLKGIAHRDVKPQHILLQSRDKNSSIKLAGFGFARRVHTPRSLTSRDGTPNYVAPEILRNIPHDERVDLWSVGVVIYYLLVGYLPFMDDDQEKQFEKIRLGQYEFARGDWDHISVEARALVRGLLTVDPEDRWTIDQARHCAWLRRCDRDQLSEVNLCDSVRRLCHTRYRLRSLAMAFVSFGVGGGVGVRNHADSDDDDDEE